jgi:ABC-type sugar transport system permease subunit
MWHRIGGLPDAALYPSSGSVSRLPARIRLRPRLSSLEHHADEGLARATFSFAHRSAIRDELVNTLYFLLIHIPLQLVIALGLAQLLNQKIRGRAFFRASYFMPVIVSGVVVTILWQQLYATETGLINLLLQRFGLSGIGWLTDRRYAMPAIAIMATWKNVGLTWYSFWSVAGRFPLNCTKRRKWTARVAGKIFG